MCLLLLIVSKQRYENKHEGCVTKPIFFRFIKNSLLSLTQKFNIEDAINFLSEIQVIGRGKRHILNERLLTLMPSIDLRKSISLDVYDNHKKMHFVLLHSDQIWVSADKELFLADTKTGAIVQTIFLYGCIVEARGKHTINVDNELIYINEYHDIIKHLKDDKETILKQRTDEWKPRCVYCCPSNGDLLVGMSKRHENISRSKISLFHNAGHTTKTIKQDKTEYMLLYEPRYITENNNGDVVVSCTKDNDMYCGAVMVSDRHGRHRFTYTGPPFGPRLAPRGICTDPLSNILVCTCDRNSSVQIIDKNGEFLVYLRTGISEPATVEFDTNSYLLWVGDGKSNTLHNMRYLSRQGRFFVFCCI